MQAQYGDNCLSRSKSYEWIDHFEKEELVHVMSRDQEGRQRQGLRTIFKPLKEWYGKADELQGTTLGRLPFI
jgi:hypothetical protein